MDQSSTKEYKKISPFSGSLWLNHSSFDPIFEAPTDQDSRMRLLKEWKRNSNALVNVMCGYNLMDKETSLKYILHLTNYSSTIALQYILDLFSSMYSRLPEYLSKGVKKVIESDASVDCEGWSEKLLAFLSQIDNTIDIPVQQTNFFQFITEFVKEFVEADKSLINMLFCDFSNHFYLLQCLFVERDYLSLDDMQAHIGTIGHEQIGDAFLSSKSISTLPDISEPNGIILFKELLGFLKKDEDAMIIALLQSKKVFTNVTNILEVMMSSILEVKSESFKCSKMNQVLQKLASSGNTKTNIISSRAKEVLILSRIPDLEILKAELETHFSLAIKTGSKIELIKEFVSRSSAYNLDIIPLFFFHKNTSFKEIALEVYLKRIVEGLENLNFSKISNQRYSFSHSILVP